jgi:hypothetical protein
MISYNTQVFNLSDKPSYDELRQNLSSEEWAVMGPTCFNYPANVRIKNIHVLKTFVIYQVINLYRNWLLDINELVRIGAQYLLVMFSQY